MTHIQTFWLSLIGAATMAVTLYFLGFSGDPGIPALGFGMGCYCGIRCGRAAGWEEASHLFDRGQRRMP